MNATSKTMRIKLTMNGFHGYQSENVRASVEKNPEYSGDRETDFYGRELPYTVTITRSAADKFACRAADCCCGESMPTEFGATEHEIDHRAVEVSGNYPQR